jgi:hypothetical protein
MGAFSAFIVSDTDPNNLKNEKNIWLATNLPS